MLARLYSVFPPLSFLKGDILKRGAIETEENFERSRRVNSGVKCINEKKTCLRY
jgi:hypothetical protein